MNSDDIEQIMIEVIEDLMGEPGVDEEVLQAFTDRVLKRIRLWEE